jgi:rubrerythrin
MPGREFSPRQLLNRAIGKEVQASTMYEIYADKVEDKQGKKLLKELAREELGHKQTLEKIDPEEPGAFRSQTIPTGEFIEFSDAPAITKESTMQEVLRYAIGEELDAFNFYSSLAQQADNTTLRNLLNRIAAEEKKHKNKLEQMYDDMFQSEN